VVGRTKKNQREGIRLGDFEKGKTGGNIGKGKVPEKGKKRPTLRFGRKRHCYTRTTERRSPGGKTDLGQTGKEKWMRSGKKGKFPGCFKKRNTAA